MKVLDATRLDALSAQAAAAPRRRLNLNLHTPDDEAVNRLANAVMPGSYIRPHRHPDRWELLVALRGSFDIVLFDDDGRVQARQRLGGTGGAAVVEYPPGTWHSVLALEPGSVFFEVKPGPYVPGAAADWLPGAPPEGAPEVDAFLAFISSAALGDRWR